MKDLITICVVEDHEEIRNGLAAIITMTEGMHVLGTFANAEQALQEIPLMQPDIVIMDINLPDINGIECIVRIREKCPTIQFMMFTIYENSDTVFQALEAGATGYLLKNSPPSRIIESLHEMHKGGSPMNADIAKKLVLRFQNQSMLNNEYNLTPKEIQILKLLAKGYFYKEIAEEQGVSVNTVKEHIRHIYEKLHVQNRSEAINKMFLK